MAESGTIPIVAKGSSSTSVDYASYVAEALVSSGTAQEAEAIAGDLRGFRAERGSRAGGGEHGVGTNADSRAASALRQEVAVEAVAASLLGRSVIGKDGVLLGANGGVLGCVARVVGDRLDLLSDSKEDAMAVGLRIKFDGGRQEQYEAVHSHMNIDQDPPDGLIFHSAGPIEGGWGIIDFWESREAFDRFLESGFGPAAQELGDRTFTTPPDIKEFPVHKISKP